MCSLCAGVWVCAHACACIVAGWACGCHMLHLFFLSCVNSLYKVSCVTEHNGSAVTDWSFRQPGTAGKILPLILHHAVSALRALQQGQGGRWGKDSLYKNTLEGSVRELCTHAGCRLCVLCARESVTFSLMFV